MEKLSDKQWVDALCYSDMEFCCQELFQRVINKQEVLSKVAIFLLKIHKNKQPQLEVFGKEDILSETTTKTHPDFHVEDKTINRGHLE